MIDRIMIFKLTSQIKQSEKKLARMGKEEARARNQWNRGYQRYRQAAKDLATLKRHKTEREERLRKIILGWDKETVRLTRKRDETRAAIKQEQEKMTQLRIGYAQYLKEMEAEIKATDEIVNQSFLLSLSAAEAFSRRNVYLNEHVYPRLVDEQGNMCSQITFDYSDGKRRVVVMVNTITIVDSYLAAEAKAQIEKFFLKFQEQAGMNGLTQKLYELTRKLLIEKTRFKVGPDLYVFLSMNLDPDLFPELAEAQRLLKLSIRSEKTSSYIRIYQRKSRTDKWERVKLT